MQKLLLMVCALFGFMACTQEAIDEQTAIRVDAPETIKVGFEDDETRIQLNSAQKTVWTKEDLVSVFYRSDANQKWQYQGETGERVGNLKRMEDATATTQTTKTVVVYPYSKNYWLNTDNYAIDATLPATQYYAAGSYGVGSNLMVSQSEFTQFSLKSVCGWLKLQLTGNGELVKSIKFRGNNGEQVAGLIYVDTATAEATLASEMGGTDDNNAGGNLVFDDTIITEVVLDCGEGVELGKNATAFYIALPPQTFEQGFTVEIEDTEGYVMEQSTDKALTIERNHIQPMAALEAEFNELTQPNNEIWYTSTDGEIVNPYHANRFGAKMVSNTYDAAKECWVIKFDGDVTTIGDWAFSNCSSLTSVNIPDSVTTIGDYAFYNCGSLTSVTIPDSVTTIGEDAFSSCISLTSVTIPDSVTTIGDYAFYKCSSLTSVNIGDSVTKIGERAFSNCSSLTSVTIPDSVTTIGDYAFYCCSNLTSVTIPDSVTTIGKDAFGGCNSLRSVTIPDSVTTIGSYAFSNCSSLISVNIGDSVTTIGDSTFQYCDSLTSVNIPDSVTEIGWSAFSHCTSLTSVNIGDSVTEIGHYTFQYCDSLTSVTIPDSVTAIGNFAFYYCSSLISVTIGDSVTTIGWSAFSRCSSLTSVNIPDSVTSIGEAAFNYCTSLTSVNIGDSVTTIGELAFALCTSLKSVNIGDSVTTIGNWVFRECTSLTSVNIPDSVTTIGDQAFRYCDSLKSVYCKATTPPSLGSYVFDSNGSGRKIYVPMESVEAYKSASYWSNYASSIVGYDF